MSKKKVNEFLLDHIINDFKEYYWDDLWESVNKGGLSEVIIRDHNLIDEDDYDGQKVWDDLMDDKITKQFIYHLDNILDKTIKITKQIFNHTGVQEAQELKNFYTHLYINQCKN